VIFISHYNVIVGRRLRAGAWPSMFALAMAAMPLSTSGAGTYVVDSQSPTGSLSGPGTEAQPYSTIGAAVAARKGAGVTIVVRPGVYREQISVPASGAEGAPYVIRAEGPGVVIEGADDFTDEGLWIQPGPVAIPGAENLRVIRETDTWLAPGVTWAPRQVFVGGRRLTRSTAAPNLLPANAFTWVGGSGLYVNLGGDRPGREEILVGRRTHGFRIWGKSWITIDGFEIRHVDDTAIDLYLGCSDILVARNRITLSENYGIKGAGGTRIVIAENSVSESSLHGIGLSAGASDCVIRGNESFRNAQPATRAAKGIYLQGAPNNVIAGNRTYENQDSGVQINAGSHNCLLYNNRSWNNGDHGYDHLDATGTMHLHNVAYGNHKDGFSIEGDSPGTSIFNSISVNNGLTTNRFDLWVNAASAIGFTSGYNIIWNETNQEPVKFMTTIYDLLTEYTTESGQDAHSMQADPMFADAQNGDFSPRKGSPAIDAGNSAVPNWPAIDFVGNPRFDDQSAPNHGAGPVTFADIGAVEYTESVDDDTVKLPSPLPAPGGAGIHAAQDAGPAESLALSTGFPNPSRGPVEFALELPRESQVEWSVYDLQGRAVWSEGRTLAAGRTQLRWDGTTSTGEPTATGVYLVRARVNGAQFTRRVIRF